jgi:hypothetical protein
MSGRIARWMALAGLAAGAAWGQITPGCTPATLPQVVGTAVSITCTPTGGTAPYGWPQTLAGLPPGLAWDGNGNITGTLADPPGPYSFTVTVTDSSTPTPLTGTQAYSGTTVDPLAVSCVPPAPSGPVEAGVLYTATCTGSGGTQGYNWSIVGSAVPPGMSSAITPTGNPATITYTPPSAMASYQYHVHVTDSSTPALSADSAIFSGAIAPAVTITTTSLPAAVVGTAYNQTLVASGGVFPYTWTLTAGALPPGLTLAATGSITGSPTASGPFNFTATVTDGAGGSSGQALSLTVDPALAITTASPLPAATVGTVYSQTFAATGGTGTGYTWSATGLPAWLTMSAAGVLGGTPPTTAVNASFTVTVTDSSNASTNAPFTLPVNLVITTTSPLPTATVGTAYSQTLAAEGGAGGYTWSSTNLPAWLSLSAAGALTGTPTAGGPANFNVTVKDSANVTQTAAFSLTVNWAPLAITTNSPLTGGTIGAPYSQTLAGTGGNSVYTWSVTAGALPGGLSLNASSGVISGTPSAAGSFTFTIQLSDSASTPPVTKQFSITIASGLTITTPPTLPTGTAGTPYAQTLTGAGGTPPYTWSITIGTLPAPLTLDSTSGAISGIPAAAGTSNFTVQVKDSLSVTATKAFTLTIAAGLSITTATPLPSAEIGVAYSQTLAASGGTPPYTWSVIAGGLPAGVTQSASGVITGTPSATGLFTFTAEVTDSNSVTASKALTLTVVTALGISTPATLASGSIGASYSQTLTATEGLPPYTWTLTAGALPPGLTLSTTGSITGSPAATGTFNFTAKVTDSVSAAASRQFSISIGVGLTISSPAVLPGGTIGTAYSHQLQAVGGNAPYTWALTAGSLPAGLTLSSSGVMQGNPETTGAFSFTAQVTDSSSNKASKQFSLTVAPVLSITTSALPGGVVGVEYSQTLAASGGTPPYSWSVSAGSLPPGLALSGAGAITGTPTAAVVFEFTVQAADSLNVIATAQLSIAIRAALSISTGTALAGGSVGSSYTQTLAASGGTPPYTWTVTAGSLPAGLALGANGLISGTPAAAGSFTFTAEVADSASAQASKQFTLKIVSGLTISTAAALPDGAVGAAYSQALAAAGGTPPYAWTVTAGTLPAGLALSAGGVLSGTPSSAGTSTFTVQVTDSASAKASQQFTLTVTGNLAITTTSLPHGSTNAAYSQSLAATGGTAPYTWSITTGALPVGLTLSAAGAIAGTPSRGGTFSFTVQVTDQAAAAASQPLTIAVAGISTPPGLPDAAVGIAYSQALLVSLGAPPYQWRVTQGALPAGLSLEAASGIISGTPTAAGDFTITVQVTDSTPVTYAGNFTLTVLAAPAASFSGIEPTANPATQMNIGLALASAYASDITGKVTLTFQPDASLTNPADDPSIQFSSGGRTADFTIPAGSTAPVQFSLQTGTVAGTITLSVSWEAGGVTLGVPADLTQTIKIAPAAPVITNVAATSTSSGFQVQVTAYSTTRELTQAAVHFTAAAGQTLQTTDVTVPLSNAAGAWFQGSTSAQYGSQFILTLPFTVSNGSAGAIGSVSVTLTNGAGTSSAGSGSL